MLKIEITAQDLINIVRDFDPDNFDSKPIDSLGYCQYMFAQFSSQVDLKKSRKHLESQESLEELQRCSYCGEKIYCPHCNHE